MNSIRSLAGEINVGKVSPGMQSSWFSAPRELTLQSNTSYSITVDDKPKRILSSILTVDEDAPQVANSFLEATERLLKQGSQYKEKHEDYSRRLAGTYVPVGSELHPENVKDLLEKKRREAINALGESEESVRCQAKRKESYLVPDLEWERFKENAMAQHIAAGSCGMVALLRNRKQVSSSVTGSQEHFGDRQLTGDELLLVEALRQCNDEILSTHSAVSNLAERFSSIFLNAPDKTLSDLWTAFTSVASQARGDTRSLLDHGPIALDQIASIRVSDDFSKRIINSARSFLEVSAYTAAEEQIRNPVRDVTETAGGESSNAVVSYARSQLAKHRMAVESAGPRLHGLPIWALIFYSIRLGAVKTALHFCNQGDSTAKGFSRYLTEYLRNNGTLLATSALELQTLCRNQPLDGSHSDIYRRAVMSILSRAEPEQDFGGITHSVRDWLWMKLTQTDVVSTSGAMLLPQLQQVVRSRFPVSQTDDCEAFLAFILTGQFEIAVERLFTNLKFRPHAVCMAIALKQSKLLLTSYAPQSASVVTERDGLFFLDFATVVRSYVDGFRRHHLDHALEYYFHLSDTPAVQSTSYDHVFANLFEFCVYKLAKDTGNFGALFSVSETGTGQVPKKCLVSRLLSDSSRVLMAVAEDLTADGELSSGLALFEAAKQITSLFRTLLKALSDDVVFPSTPETRQNLYMLATRYAERYQVSGNDDDVIIRNVYIMLDLITFFNLVNNQEFRHALAAMKSINLIPLEQSAVGTAVAMFQNDLLPETQECIPLVTLQTMQILCNCYIAEKELILSSRMGAEVQSTLRTATLRVSGVRLSDSLLKLQTSYRKQSRAVLDFASKIPSPQLPNLMDLLIKLELALA